MRILHVYDLGPFSKGTTTGGIETHIISLLTNLSKKGHKCYLLTGAIPNETTKEILNEITIFRIDFGDLVRKTWRPHNLTFTHQLSFLFAYLRKKFGALPPLDLVHGHIYSAGIISYLISRKNNIPFVNTFHGSYHGQWRNISPGMFRPHFFNFTERVLLPTLGKLADIQIHTDKSFAKKAFNWGVPPNKIRVILNGVDTTRFNPGVPSLDLSFPNPKILAIRRLVPKNGVHILIKAFADVLDLIPSAQLLIVGDGPQKPYLEKITQKRGILESVHFLGSVQNHLIPRLIASVDLVVVPSLVEASSISLLEAMSSQKPCIASKIPGIDLISDSKSVVYFEPNNSQDLTIKIRNLLTNTTKAQTLAKNGRKRVLESHTIEHMTSEIEKVYFYLNEKKKI